MRSLKDTWLQTRRIIADAIKRRKRRPEPPQTPRQQPPGLDCPRCRFRITVTIEMLLAPEPIVCPGCQLELHVDREKSQDTLDAARKLHDAMQRVEEVKKGIRR